jgi:hypothetical protein
MIPLAGAAGLATDTVQWVLWKRELQRAADSAAIAGANAEAQSETVKDAVTADLAENNNHTGVSLLANYPDIQYPTSAISNNEVQVTLKIQKALGFSSLFLSTPPTISATATAALIDDGSYCLRTIRKSGGPGITITGTANINLGCGGHSDSIDNPSVSATGNYTMSAPVMAGVGTMPGSINGVTKILSHTLYQPDPYQGKYSTTNPYGNGSCKNFSQNAYTTSVTTGSGKDKVTTTTNHLSAGCYSSFSPNGSNTYYLDPGVYYLSGTDFNLNGQDTLIGTDVVFILDTGSVSVNGTSTVQISAPTSTNCGTYSGVSTCSYKNMLFIQSSSATTGNKNTINGTSNSSYDGGLYFPNGELDFTGDTGAITKCLNVVSYTAVFSGHADLQNNTTGCNANTTSTIQEIRLVG